MPKDKVFEIGKNLQMDYDEGLYVGYRWYEKEGIKPLFPFGHGLSYTTFEYSDLRIIPPKTQNSAISFEVTISNTGGFKGKEVVQCYVKVENSRINRPSKELKVFEKVELDIGESKKLIFNYKVRFTQLLRNILCCARNHLVVKLSL